MGKTPSIGLFTIQAHIWVLFSFQTFASDSEFKDLKCPQCSKTDDLKRVNRGVIETLQNLEDDKVSEEELKELRGYLEYLEKYFPNKPAVKVKKSIFTQAMESLLRIFTRKTEVSPQIEPETLFMNKSVQDVIYKIVNMTIYYVSDVEHTGKTCNLRDMEDDEKRLNIEPKIDISDIENFIDKYRKAYYKVLNISRSDLFQNKEKCDLIMQILSILNAVPERYKIEGHDKQYNDLNDAMKYMQNQKGNQLAYLFYGMGHALSVYKRVCDDADESGENLTNQEKELRILQYISDNPPL